MDGCQALLARALDGPLARAAGLLCGQAGTADIVDASIALVTAARSRGGPAAVVTSDPPTSDSCFRHWARQPAWSPTDNEQRSVRAASFPLCESGVGVFGHGSQAGVIDQVPHISITKDIT